jgi:TFIIF-interacting CTD phosphatase-like protein
VFLFDVGINIRTDLKSTTSHYREEIIVEEEEYEEVPDAVEEFNPYLFMKQLPCYKSIVPVPRSAVLPRKTRKSPPISLVLDLDETLVHCNVEAIPDADMVRDLPPPALYSFNYISNEFMWCNKCTDLPC